MDGMVASLLAGGTHISTSSAGHSAAAMLCTKVRFRLTGVVVTCHVV